MHASRKQNQHDQAHELTRVQTQSPTAESDQDPSDNPYQHKFIVASMTNNIEMISFEKPEKNPLIGLINFRSLGDITTVCCQLSLIQTVGSGILSIFMFIIVAAVYNSLWTVGILAFALSYNMLKAHTLFRSTEFEKLFTENVTHTPEYHRIGRKLYISWCIDVFYSFWCLIVILSSWIDFNSMSKYDTYHSNVDTSDKITMNIVFCILFILLLVFVFLGVLVAGDWPYYFKQHMYRCYKLSRTHNIVKKDEYFLYFAEIKPIRTTTKTPLDDKPDCACMINCFGFGCCSAYLAVAFGVVFNMASLFIQFVFLDTNEFNSITVGFISFCVTFIFTIPNIFGIFFYVNFCYVCKCDTSDIFGTNGTITIKQFKKYHQKYVIADFVKCLLVANVLSGIVICACAGISAFIGLVVNENNNNNANSDVYRDRLITWLYVAGFGDLLSLLLIVSGCYGLYFITKQGRRNMKSINVGSLVAKIHEKRKNSPFKGVQASLKPASPTQKSNKNRNKTKKNVAQSETSMVVVLGTKPSK